MHIQVHKALPQLLGRDFMWGHFPSRCGCKRFLPMIVFLVKICEHLKQFLN